MLNYSIFFNNTLLTVQMVQTDRKQTVYWNILNHPSKENTEILQL